MPWTDPPGVINLSYLLPLVGPDDTIEEILMDTESQIEDLREGAAQLGLELTSSQIDLFSRYLEEILAFNRRRNIVSRNDAKRIASYHFIDSLAVLDLLPAGKGLKCLDLGSGAGFPGIPLKIVRPDLRFTLIEPKRWRSIFLRRAVTALGLDDVAVFRGRVEDSQSNWGGQAVILARAVAELRELVSISIPLLSPRGLLIAYKSKDVPDEIVRAARRLLLHEAKVTSLKKVMLPLTGITRVFVVIEKTAGPPPDQPQN